MLKFRLPFAGRKFARPATFLAACAVIAATSVASMPLNRPPLPDPDIDLVLPPVAFLDPPVIDTTIPLPDFRIQKALFLAKPPIDSIPPVSEKQIACLATAVYFEARGESATGQKAVAQVILNRVESKAYPNTICGVVYQNHTRRNACQFSFACDGHSDVVREKKAWQRAQSVAKDIVRGTGVPSAVLTATHYHATSVHPRWANKLTRLSRIGRHIFYRG